MKINLDAAIETEAPTVTVNEVVVEPGKQLNISTTDSGLLPMNQTESSRMIEYGKNRFAPYDPKIDDLLKQARAIEVKNAESEKISNDIGLKAKKFAKELRAKEKILVGPADDFVKAIHTFVKGYIDRCDRIERETKEKGVRYATWRKLEEAKARKIMQEARDVVQRQVDEEFKELGVPAPQLQPAVVPEDAKHVTRTEHGTVSYTTKQKGKVINPDILPEKYWIKTINQKMIDEDVRNGIVIPGVEPYDEVTPRYLT